MTNSTKATRSLKNIHFDPETAEISMTDESQGGPASGLTTVLCKSGKQPTEDDLTPEQAAKLERYGEIFSPLRKQQSDTNSLSSVKSDAGEEQTMTKGNEMSDAQKDALQEAQDEIAILKKALQAKETQELTSEVEKFKLSNTEDVVKVLQGVSVDEKEAITKAFAELVESKESLEKSASKQDAIDKKFGELGEDGEAEAVTKSLNINEELKELNKEAK